MKEFTAKKLSVLALVILIMVCFVFPVNAAEKRKFSITTKVIGEPNRSVINLEDNPKHSLIQNASKRTMTSSNPDFNGMDVINFGQSDDIAGTGSHTGYSFYYHKNGDKVFTKYEGTHKTTVKEDKSWETISAGKLEFIGGTGMFKNIKGGGPYKCFATVNASGCDADFEGEY